MTNQKKIDLLKQCIKKKHWGDVATCPLCRNMKTCEQCIKEILEPCLGHHQGCRSWVPKGYKGPIQHVWSYWCSVTQKWTAHEKDAFRRKANEQIREAIKELEKKSK